MLALAAGEQRTLLTRDAQLYLRATEKYEVSSLLIKDDSVFQQLKQVRAHLALTFPSEPTIVRCSVCNGMIQHAPGEVVCQSREIKMLCSKGVNVSEFMRRHREFYTCTSCGKVFWKGSHWHGILQKTRHLSA